jgi:hypothetical protein
MLTLRTKVIQQKKRKIAEIISTVATSNALTNCRSKFENVPRTFGPKPNKIKQAEQIRDDVERYLECTADKMNV